MISGKIRFGPRAENEATRGAAGFFMTSLFNMFTRGSLYNRETLTHLNKVIINIMRQSPSYQKESSPGGVHVGHNYIILLVVYSHAS